MNPISLVRTCYHNWLSIKESTIWMKCITVTKQSLGMAVICYSLAIIWSPKYRSMPMTSILTFWLMMIIFRGWINSRCACRFIMVIWTASLIFQIKFLSGRKSFCHSCLIDSLMLWIVLMRHLTIWNMARPLTCIPQWYRLLLNSVLISRLMIFSLTRYKSSFLTTIYRTLLLRFLSSS